MKVNVLFFGATADIVEQRRVEYTIEENVDAKAVFEKLLAEFPKLKDHKLLFSVNQEYATDERVIGDGDELAVFTAVSGG